MKRRFPSVSTEYQLAIHALIAFERNVAENFIGAVVERADAGTGRGSKQNGSRCDFVSTLRDPQPCSRETFAYPQSRRPRLQSRRRARIFLRARELWRYDSVRVYARVADKRASRRVPPCSRCLAYSFRTGRAVFLWGRIVGRSFVSPSFLSRPVISFIRIANRVLAGVAAGNLAD